MVQDSWVEQGIEARGKWIPAKEYDDQQIITRTHSLCVMGDLVCVLRNPHTGAPRLPGGTVENGENAVQTLHREVKEEANLELSNPTMLGVQRVQYGDTHPSYEKDQIYQARYISEIERANFVTEDPSGGFTYQRSFVPLDDFPDVIGWGDVAEELVRLAKQKSS